MFALAHLSDPHLAGWRRGPWRSLLNKRLSGYLSWAFSRRKIHLSKILDLLIADLRAKSPDHAALTGDVINIAVPDEFALASHWLRSWADPRSLSLIPGNHDCYMPLSWEESLGSWQDYMTSFQDGDHAQPANAKVEFPYVRILGEIAIVGVSSACPMPLFVAAGRVGRDQLQRLRSALLSLRRLGLFRVVLIHHPPFAAPFLKRRKALLDADSFADTIRECGAELILHGHTHTNLFGRIGNVPVFGVPSASARAWGHKDAASYNIYHIGREGPRWKVNVEARGLSKDEQQIQSRGHFSFFVESPVHA